MTGKLFFIRMINEGYNDLRVQGSWDVLAGGGVINKGV